MEGGRGSLSTKEIRRVEDTEGERSLCPSVPVVYVGARRLLFVGLVLPGRTAGGFDVGLYEDTDLERPCRCCEDAELFL